MAMLQIPITKAKSSVGVDTDALPMHVYEYALMLGLKELANRGMTKITVAKLTGEDLAGAQAAALTKGQENVANIVAGNIKITGSKAETKVPGAVMTEARRIARNIIKDEMKKAGIKVSHVEASEITKAANALIAQDPEIVKQAEASLADRGKVSASSELLKSIAISPKLVAKAEEKKAKAKSETTLSAAKAGKVLPRGKGKGGEVHA